MFRNHAHVEPVPTQYYYYLYHKEETIYLQITAIVTSTNLPGMSSSSSSQTMVEIDCSDRDLEILSRDEVQYKPITWAEIHDIVATNSLIRLSRKPSDLRYYLQKKREFSANYGGTMVYILKEKLHWTLPIVASDAVYLKHASDVKVLLNDFPYGVEPNVMHFVVWLKVKIPEEADGVLSGAVKQRIAAYVKRTFQDYFGLKSDQVVWFKNSSALRSVAELEHFHVMVQDANPVLVDQLVGTSGSV